MTRPYGPDPYRRGSALSRSFLPLALITVGVVVLLSNFASSLISDRGRGGLIVLALGAAFAVGRLTTGRYGYAVPAGILIGIGAYIVIESLDVTRGASSAGWFFVMLGAGFGLAYLLGLRATAVWPLIPGVILIALGAVLLGAATLGPLASWSWIATYWPAALVLLGAWLLFREALPPAVRGPIATVGGMALLAYGLIAAAASVAAAGNFSRAGAIPGSDASPFSETVTLNAPLAAGQTFNVTNSNGTTTIHSTDDDNVHVTATRHFAFGGQPPDVQLTPDAGGGVTLGSSSSASRSRFPFGGDSSWIDYSIDVPASAAVQARSTSGKLRIDGLSGPVNATSTSGDLELTNLAGPVQAEANSGRITLTNIAGEVRASTTNGAIEGTELRHVRQAQTSNGRISLSGVFTDPAQVTASNGSIDLKLLPGSAVTLDAHSSNGSIEPQNLVLNGGVTRRDTLTGSIGNPAPDATLHAQSSNGSITISE
jgi:hypothetical protein